MRNSGWPCPNWFGTIFLPLSALSSFFFLEAKIFVCFKISDCRTWFLAHFWILMTQNVYTSGLSTANKKYLIFRWKTWGSWQGPLGLSAIVIRWLYHWPNQKHSCCHRCCCCCCCCCWCCCCCCYHATYVVMASR